MDMYIAVLVCIAFDIITGLLKACYEHNFDSTKMREGGYHKISEILVLVGAGLCEWADLEGRFGISLPVLNAVAAYIIVTELVSILENISAVNPTFNKLFKPYFEKLRGNDDDGKNL